MEILATLQRLGLPDWLLSIAAVIVILHYTGVVKWLGASLRDQQEHWQDQVERKWEAQAQDRAAIVLRQREVENQALAIAKENIQWAREDFSVMQKTVEQQARLLEHIRAEIRILAGAVARLDDKLSKE